MATIKNLSLSARIGLVLAALALIGCVVMALTAPARAELQYFSKNYVAELQQTHIGVKLTEKTGVETQDAEALPRDVSGDHGLLETTDDKNVPLVFNGDAALVPGKEYPEEISVRNASDDMNEYVRLTVRKYWAVADAEGPLKTAVLDPGLIRLTFDESNQENPDWYYAAEESTPERLVFYGKAMLKKGEYVKTPAVSAIAVDNRIKNTVENYGGHCWIALDAQVDSVQTHDAPAAAKSAWGVDVSAYGLDWTQED